MQNLSERAGRLLRELVDVSRDSVADAKLRSRIVSAATAGSGRLRVARAVWLAAALAMVALIGFGSWRLWPQSEAPLAFTVGPHRLQGRVGDYHSARSQTLALGFSDGSEIRLNPGAGARVSHTDPRGATVLIEKGAADVQVASRAGALWRLSAGPYTVQVTGTAFRMSWDQDSGLLAIAMRSGSVVVRGPGIESGVVVSGSEYFSTQVSAALGRKETTNAQASESPLPQSSSSSISPPSRQLARGEERRASDANAEASTDWPKLARSSRYRDIVRAAERRGLDSVLSTADSPALVALADAARFSSRAELARRALISVRQRFAATPAAADAAFVLGKMEDDTGQRATALAWYDRYLTEAPSGHFAAEALGRRMLALRALGNASASRQAAEEYLHRFPDGPYVSVAQELSAP